MKPPLIIAEAANPEWASVPLVGWSHASMLQAKTGAHLVTQIRNREAIIRSGLSETEFTAIDSEAVAARIHALGTRLRGGAGKGWTTVMALSSISYRYFESLVWKRFESDLRSGKYSLVHRITPLSPTVPSSLAAKCRSIGVPFVLGPLNGGVPWPKQFDAVRRAEREWLAPVRSAYKWLPGYRSTLRNSAAIICGSRHTANEVPQRFQEKVIYVPENGIDPARFAARRTRRACVPLRCIFLGRLVPYKGVDLLVEAITPLAKSGKLTLDIVGDGPQYGQVQDLIRNSGIEDTVRMIGSVPHREVQDHLAACDILTFPSVREFGGGVILESMAVGVVPMAVDYAGPSELMTESSSFRIPLGTREEIIQRFRSELERLIADPGEIDRRSAAAMMRVYSHFTWERKAEQSLAVYEWVLGLRREKPSFDFV